MHKLTTFITIVACLIAFAVPAMAEYPEKPIKMIVPYNAGSGSDTQARYLQKALEKVLPQPIAIINKPGSVSAIGSRAAAEAKPDGYTILFNHLNLFSSYAMGLSPAGPDSFEPIAQITLDQVFYIVGKNSRFKSMKQLIDEAIKAPNTVKEGTNIGAIPHLISLSMCDAVSGLKFRYVQQGDNVKRFASLLGNHIDLTLTGGESKPFLESGDFKPLVALTAERLPDLPEVPTLKELGYDYVFPGFPRWVLAPKGTPKEAIDYLRNAIKKALDLPGVKESYAKNGWQVSYLDGEENMKNYMKIAESITSVVEKYNLKKK